MAVLWRLKKFIEKMRKTKTLHNRSNWIARVMARTWNLLKVKFTPVCQLCSNWLCFENQNWKKNKKIDIFQDKMIEQGSYRIKGTGKSCVRKYISIHNRCYSPGHILQWMSYYSNISEIYACIRKNICF